MHRGWKPSPSHCFAMGPSLSRDEARERDVSHTIALTRQGRRRRDEGFTGKTP
jgi:hypothetical protein